MEKAISDVAGLHIVWLDDFRDPTKFIKEPCKWIKDYESFCSFINEYGLPEKIYFDHDLGEGKSGYDCAKFVVDYCQKYNFDIPDYEIQSANPVGKDNISGILESWHRFYSNRRNYPLTHLVLTK